MASWRSCAVPFAAVAVKGLRFASMNAQQARALDRRPRCGEIRGHDTYPRLRCSW